MKGGSYEDIPNPKNTVVTVPGEGIMTEEEWQKSVDDTLVRNGYAGVGGKHSSKHGKRSSKHGKHSSKRGKRSSKRGKHSSKKRRGSLKKRHPTRRRRS